MSVVTRTRLRAVATGAAIVAATGVLLAGCGSPERDDSADDGRLPVLASFYPLKYLAEQVGGDRVTVSSLTPPGIDPHNVELSPRAVADVESAELVGYLSGFQPAVDDALARTDAGSFDAAEHADLLTATDDDDHDHGPLDPHFWLDPIRFADVGAALAEDLATMDPDGAESYRANSEALTAELTELDAEYRTTLTQCERDTIVVAHEAYGYLSAAYGLDQEGMSGLDPDAEPSPARLAELEQIIAAEDVTTIFVESETGSPVSNALAGDLGVRTAVLDPLENQQDDDADYLAVQRANLAALDEALDCG